MGEEMAAAAACAAPPRPRFPLPHLVGVELYLRNKEEVSGAWKPRPHPRAAAVILRPRAPAPRAHGSSRSAAVLASAKPRLAAETT